MSIKTNSLDYVIDKQKIEEKYDIFCLETSEKYIKRGAYILDVSVMCNDIKAINSNAKKHGAGTIRQR